MYKPQMSSGVIREFIFEENRRGECHAATLLALPSGDFLACWFWGSEEGKGDTAIWLARRTTSGWQPPRKLADREAVPHWNPVLFRAPDGRIYLYYKIGARISAWQTWVMTSADDGQSWSEPYELVPGERGGRGPVKNKPIVASNGTWLAPASREDKPWRCFVDISTDNGRSWHASAPISFADENFPGEGMIQPTLWESAPGQIHMLIRSSCGFVCRSDSRDYGQSWRPAYRTALPNNNCGIDLARLSGGELVLAHNPVGINWGARTPLVLSLSRDNGHSWETLLTLEDEGVSTDTERVNRHFEFSYPAVISAGEGVAVAYTWKRQRMVFVRPGALTLEKEKSSHL